LPAIGFTEEGLNRIAFEASVAEKSGTAVLEAAVRIGGDPFAENNTFGNH
jgi:hypothetical protein